MEPDRKERRTVFCVVQREDSELTVEEPLRQQHGQAGRMGAAGGDG